MTRNNYSKEFKEDAMRVAEREGVNRACEKLGLKPSQIYDWRKTNEKSKLVCQKA